MASAAPTDALELTGILAATDSYGRLRLCLVDALETPAGGGRHAPDHSWARLRKAVPERKGYNVPYNFPLNGAPDDAGIRGECWVRPPAPAKGAGGRRARILALAEELRGKEVVLTVRPKRYSFVSQAAHNHGAEVGGTTLSLCDIVSLEPRASAPMQHLNRPGEGYTTPASARHHV